MDDEASWAAAAREVAASAPPLSPESRAELIAKLRVLAAQRAAQQPEAVARRERLHDLRTEKRLSCERYLGGEITLTAMNRRLCFLEDEGRRSTD